MLLRLSTLFVRTLREDPADAEVASHKLLVRAGYIRRAAPGIYTWLPLGLRVLAKVEAVVREEMAAAGAQEVHFPALLPKEPYEATGRWTEYGPNIFRLKDRKGGDYLLAPTHEELFTLLVKDLYSSYKDLPLTLFQIQTKYRDEARPRAGLIRGREFVMKDAYSFDVDDAGLDASYAAQRAAYQRVFERLGLEYVIVSATSGAMGGSRSEEFLTPTAIGEDTFVRSAGGYAANVEAVTTVAPPALDWSDAPAAHVEDTPDTPTIDTLVTVSNDRFPRADRPWTAADTLKNVVLALVHPSGERELLVVGLPGDREVDLKRLEAALAPAEVEAAGEADFAAHPELVKGYIGPGVLGPNVPVADGAERTAVRYLLDPRVVDGTRWITGANEPGRHVYDLVAGRDFTADGTVEAAEVRAGDPAPDGSGPLELARGIEIGHIFQLGRKYAQALGLTVLDQNGKSQVVTMGSYGIGVTRVLAALAEANHDDRGLAWPAHVAPAHVHVVATGKDASVFEAAEDVAAQLVARGVEVLYDDRPKVSPGVKFADAELFGVPLVVVVGRGLAEGLVEVRPRVGGEPVQVPVADVVEHVAGRVAELLAR
ncbi:proline--tRNA ligase [Cellulomonas fimi]|uniref:Proline--tRNA ligase n=1 Tax=Cellulomonas fimi (strain ATCC 484 / DSM 20113 / JCM 1341 / CCUG 24087 / LMG 16345 / NBRC 15513 / NCIMB 8980 / NCTC 7547 / NRS-133) TaxID=590998 RepID=F4H728_CELFA|nr:proline--tRNA ligase [Cellulomonas fimi]AEE45662.1 prolyl-tRNA synthetase [Cellulomonas fimi ATCC 484]NNH08044.1 proline--tRNA ligase [Cellulomonas fimi]VEH30217.1 Proline--tRNA ligase [Cellulomonas fimi]